MFQMKKQFTFIVMMLLMASWAFSQEVIVEWTFPNDSADSIADGGISQNLDKVITTMGGTSAINYKNGATSKAAQATQWDNGAGLKCWVVSFNTEVYGDLTLSSKLSSGGNDPGPRDFRVDYCIGDDGTWTEVPNSAIVTANDWETGVLENLPLPEACNNQPLVYLRWIMTSDTAAEGGLVEPSGKLKIDDIVVSGTDMSAVGEMLPTQVRIYPNPCTSVLNIDNNDARNYAIYTLDGRMIDHGQVNGSIRIADRLSGCYLISLFDENGTAIHSQKFLVK